MRALKLISLAALISMAAFVGCKKGDTGATGPQGPAGPDSVLYSSWQTITMSYETSSGSDSVFTGTITAAAITQPILDSGLVVAYIRFSDGSITSTESLGAVGVLVVNYAVGQINLLSGEDYTGASLRYVIVPGSKSLNKATAQKLKTLSYSDAVKQFGLN